MRRKPGMSVAYCVVPFIKFKAGKLIVVTEIGMWSVEERSDWKGT